MRKIIELCLVLILGVVYLVFTSRIPIKLNELSVMLQFTCEILRIVISLGGFIFIYRNMKTKINNKANYIAGSLFEYCILCIIGVKFYIYPDSIDLYGAYVLFRGSMEIFQISLIIIALKFINEDSNLKRWFKGQLVIVTIVAVLIFNSLNIVTSLFNNPQIEILWKIAIVIISVFSLIICKKSINNENIFHGRVFTNLLWIKVILNILEIIKIQEKISWILWVQYILQAYFIIRLVMYVDEFTMEHIWIKVEYGITSKMYQVEIGKDEQKILVMATEKIKSHIRKIVEKVDELEKVLKNDNKKYLDKIKSNSYRLSNLSDSILQSNEYGLNLNQLSFSKIDLSKYVGNIISSLEPYIQQKDKKIEYLTSTTPIIAEVNEGAIERVLLNLLSNAVKYNKKAGRIQVVLSQKRKCVYLCVKDSGIGISNENLQGIFEKFKRIDSEDTNRQEGSGLGLCIVKSLIELHKGHIKVASDEGKGTIISIEIPLVQENSNINI